MTKWIATLGIGAALAFAAPTVSQAQGPVIAGGLVNVTLVNVLNNNTVLSYDRILQNVGIGVAANVAAQVCGVQVNVPVGVIASQVARTGQATACEIPNQDGTVTQVLVGQ